MYFNKFSTTTEPVDMAATDEFASLLQGAKELGTAHKPDVRYVSRNIVANGLRFHLLEWGDPSAETVLLLHGNNHTAHTWDLVSLALATEGYHVIALDMRGHGDSEWPRDGDMTVTAMSGDLEAIFEVLGIDGIRMVAHSRGGRSLMPILARRNMATRLVLVDVAPAREKPIPAEQRVRAAALGAQATFTNTREYPSIDAYVDAVQKFDPSRSREAVLRTMRYNMIQRVDGTLSVKTAPINQAIDDPFGDSTIEEMKTISVPVLLLRGANSPNLAQEHAEAWAAALPDARLVVVPNCGHNVHTQNTVGFLASTVPFLKGAPVPV